MRDDGVFLAHPHGHVLTQRIPEELNSIAITILANLKRHFSWFKGALDISAILTRG